MTAARGGVGEAVGKLLFRFVEPGEPGAGVDDIDAVLFAHLTENLPVVTVAQLQAAVGLDFRGGVIGEGKGAVKLGADQRKGRVQLRLVVVGTFGFFRRLCPQGLDVLFQQRQQRKALLRRQLQSAYRTQVIEAAVAGVIDRLFSGIVQLLRGIIRASDFNGDGSGIGKGLHRRSKMANLGGKKMSVAGNAVSGQESASAAEIVVYQCGIHLPRGNLFALGMGCAHHQHIPLRQRPIRVEKPIFIDFGNAVAFRTVDDHRPGPPHRRCRAFRRIQPSGLALIAKAQGVYNEKSRQQRRCPLEYLLSSVFPHKLTFSPLFWEL